MRIDNTIFFAPGIKSIDIDFDNANQIIENFEKRIYGFYLEPAQILNKHGQAFGAGVILMATIEAISYYSIDSNQNVQDFFSQVMGFKENNEKKVSEKFKLDFRDGLIHEGRIKRCGQFSYEVASLMNLENDILIINPSILLVKIEEYFRDYIKKLKNDAGYFSIFTIKLKRQFTSEIEKIKKLS